MGSPGLCLKISTVVACVFVLVVQGILDIVDNVMKFMDPTELPPGVGLPFQIVGISLAMAAVLLASAGLVSVAREDPHLARIFYLGYVVVGGLMMVEGAILLVAIHNSGHPEAGDKVQEVLPGIGFYYVSTLLVMLCAKLHSDALQDACAAGAASPLLAE